MREGLLRSLSGGKERSTLSFTTTLLRRILAGQTAHFLSEFGAELVPKQLACIWPILGGVVLWRYASRVHYVRLALSGTGDLCADQSYVELPRTLQPHATVRVDDGLVANYMSDATSCMALNG